MSVETMEVSQENDAENKLVNGERLNGVSNGHSESGDKHKSSSHKSSSKDKHRDKDRNRDKDKDRDRNKDRDKDKHRDKDHKSSSSKSSSSRDKEKDKTSSSSKDKDKDRHSSSHKSSSSRDKDRDRDKDKEKHRSRDDKDKERSKDDKERSREDKDRDKDKDKEKSKDHKSSGDKDKDKSKSSSSSSHRDKDRDKDKHKSSSSSGRDKHSSSSSSRHKDKEREKDKDKQHTSSSSSRDKDKDKDRHRRDKDRKEKEKKEEKEIVEVKEEDDEEEAPIVKEENSHENGVHLSNDEDADDVDDVKIKAEVSTMDMSQASSCDYSMSQFKQEESQFDNKFEKEEEEDPDPDPDFEEPAPEPQPDEDDSDEDIPLAKRKKEPEDDTNARKKIKTEKVKTEKKSKKSKKRAMESEEDEEEDEYVEKKKSNKKKIKKEKKLIKVEVKKETGVSPVKGGRKKKEEEPQEVWKWWEEEKKSDGCKWNFLEHKGPVFAPEYEPLPDSVKFEYDGKVMKLSPLVEEVAGFYAKMIEHEYTSKKVFNDNFFKDWRKTMTSSERDKIKDLFKCNFKYIHRHFADISEKNKSRTKEQKLKIKEDNEALIKEFGFCTIDGHKEKIGNFRIEPPGLFRGRGEHPKMGLVKRRVMPEDIIINCSKDSHPPQAPEGHRWKEVKHDNQVTWLASWVENVQGQVKYIMLNPSSKLKGEKDWAKYETARKLLKHIDKIRSTYKEEWKSKEMRIRQRAVALYFIDKLALRAGNEKDEDQADTVGCCSLRVEHIELHKELNGNENVVVFDFLGKDSIRYYNEVEVEKRVFKNLELFKENKKDGDDLFDRLNTTVMNEHLRDLMDGLTAKVFRTFNASFTLQKQLEELTDPDSSVPEKLLSYNRANRAVAILCNHQRAVPKSHDKSMSNLKEKIKLKRDAIDDCEAELRELKRSSVRDKIQKDKKTKQLERLNDQLKKLELQETDRDENKTIALGTSKLNYLDPRISVAWCKKHDVPLEKIFNKTQRDKFRWAIEMATEDYVF